MRHAFIMAGGAGVRLWPLSRRDRPKQALRFFGGTSLLRQSYERVALLLPPAQIHIVTTQSNLPFVAQELPELPPGNVIGEPVGRDTANAIGLAAALLVREDSDALMGVFPADHIITPHDVFCEALQKAYETAEMHGDALVTLGVRPSRPEPNYGYVWRGDRIGDGVFVVKKFTEKPNVAKAMKYLSTGEYYWNSGMFAWRAATILDQLKKHLPATYEGLSQVADAWATDERTTKLQAIYPGLMKISIDFAVMERAERVLVVEMGCQWVDVGSWTALETVIEADADGNVATGPEVIHLGSRGVITVSDDHHLIATLGVDDLVIVHSPDATLICKKRDASGIKELVDNVREKFGDKYL